MQPGWLTSHSHNGVQCTCNPVAHQDLEMIPVVSHYSKDGTDVSGLKFGKAGRAAAGKAVQVAKTVPRAAQMAGSAVKKGIQSVTSGYGRHSQIFNFARDLWHILNFFKRIIP